MSTVFVVESVATNANRYGAAHAIVAFEDDEGGPAHSQRRLVISGDLEALTPDGLNGIKPGLRLLIISEPG